MIDIRRWLVMAVLSVSGGMIFLAPFLREVYYIPMQEAMNLSNTQMGMLMGVFGTVSMLTYFPGGWVADRVSSGYRRLRPVFRDFPQLSSQPRAACVLGLQHHLCILGRHDQGHPWLGAFR